MAAGSSNSRNSCDACYNSKLKCNHEKPICARCKNSGLNCVYGPGKRPGRRRKNTTTTGPTRAANDNQLASPSSTQSQNQESSQVRTTGGSASCMNMNMPLSNQPPNSDFLDPAGFHDWMESCGDDFTSLLQTPESPSWMEGFVQVSPANGSQSQAPQNLWTGVNAEDTGSATGSESATSSSQHLWSPDNGQFWRDCESLGSLSAGFASVVALKDPSQPATSEPSCPCLNSVFFLQHHVRQYSSATPVPADATIYIQRLLLWILDSHRECTVCHDGDVIIFSLAGIAAQVTTGYRTILEEQHGLFRRPPESQHSILRPQSYNRHCIRLGSTAVNEFGKLSFLYRKWAQRPH